MLTFEAAHAIVESELTKLELGKEPRLLYEPMEYVLGMGGKRLRPVLTLLSCSLFTEDFRKAIPAAIALEVFHNFTLVHDDIMDNASVRRNYLTVHVKWNRNVAILSGDAMLIKAYELLSALPPSQLVPVLRVFNKTATEVCEGQQMDMDFETAEKVTEQEYLRMIELKTSVLLAACMKIGAITGGATDKISDLLYQTGIYMGLAFQLQDDFLDTFGTQETFGKEIGGDIKANKKTYLFIKALELASAADRKELLYWYAPEFQEKSLSDPVQKFTSVTSLFKKYQIDVLTEKKIQEYSSKAEEIIENLPVKTEEQQQLKSLLLMLMTRKK